MKLFLPIFMFSFPIIIGAQEVTIVQSLLSESDKGNISINVIPDRPGGPPLLNVLTFNPTGSTGNFGAPDASAIQGIAHEMGNAITGIAQKGYALRGRSTSNYGAHINSLEYHGAYFRGKKGDGYGDIVLGATEADDNGVIMSDPDIETSNLFVAANNAVVARIDKNNNGTGTFVVHGTFADAIFQVDINGNVKVNGTTVHSSDRNRKESIIEVSNYDILNAIVEMPIYEWQYKKEERRHIGPMAQDFYKAFGLGDDDKSIAAIDADGVALAAIKAQQILIEEQALQIKLLIEEIKLIKSQLQLSFRAFDSILYFFPN